MPAQRTQIYLTIEQRDRLAELGEQTGKSLASMIRDAVDVYLDQPQPDLTEALQATFGVMPDLEVPPRSEWDRGYG